MDDPTADADRADSRPLLVYDGDCQFCAYWARYWQKLTGDAVNLPAVSGGGAAISADRRSPTFNAACNTLRLMDITPALQKRAFLP